MSEFVKKGKAYKVKGISKKPKPKPKNKVSSPPPSKGSTKEIKGSTTVELTEEAANFMWCNLLAHDPCHDWNPSGNRKRMGKLNSAFERITTFHLHKKVVL